MTQDTSVYFVRMENGAIRALSGRDDNVLAAQNTKQGDTDAVAAGFRVMANLNATKLAGVLLLVGEFESIVERGRAISAAAFRAAVVISRHHAIRLAAFLRRASLGGVSAR